MALKPNISVTIDAPRIVVLYGAETLGYWDVAGDVWDSGVWDSRFGGHIPKITVGTDKVNITVNANP